MRAYETMFIIVPDLEEEQTNATVDKFTGLLAAQGATVDNVDRWGKRRLAYEVADQREGYYVVVKFKGEPKAAQELERVFKITDEVIRYLIVKEEE